MKPTITLELNDRSITLDYQSVSLTHNAEPIWSDGTFDGSYIPKIIGYMQLPPDGEVILCNGNLIHFSNFEYITDKGIIIKPPYSIDGVEVSIIP